MRKILKIKLFLLLLLSVSSLFAWTFTDNKDEYNSQKESRYRDNSNKEQGYRDTNYDEYIDGNEEQNRNSSSQSSRNYDEYQDGDNPQSSNSRRVKDKSYDEYDDISPTQSRKSNYNQYSDMKSTQTSQKSEKYDDTSFNDYLYSDDAEIEEVELEKELSDTIESNYEDIYSETPIHESSYNNPHARENSYKSQNEFYAPKQQIKFKNTNLGKSSRYYKEEFQNKNNYRHTKQREESDIDGDGVIDSNDRCSRTQAGVGVDRNGCPYDRDNDGVFDYKDKCLKTAQNAKVDKYGCSSKTIHKILTLQFEKNSNRIKYNSFASIKKFSAFMSRNPKYHAEIIGYTDSSGDSRANLALSKRRAEATKEAMIIEGIDASRMSVTGKGSDNPMYSNRTKKGREGNNRIEVELRD